MTLYEKNASEAELLALNQEQEALTGILELCKGAIDPNVRPDLVARAVRDGMPIPLKYTQSLAGLRSLYQWSLKTESMQMAEWVTRQVIQVFGIEAMGRLAASTPGYKPDYIRSARQELMHIRRNLKGQDFDQYMMRWGKKDDDFWVQQLRRVGKANKTRCSIAGKVYDKEQIKPFYDTMAAAFYCEEYVPQKKALTPAQIISQSNISGYVYLPALIEAMSPMQNWNRIISHEVIRTGMFQKLVIPVHVLLEILSYLKVPEAVLEEARRKYE